MSYLPELRTSLVKAARDRYADTSAPLKPRGTRRWLSASGVVSALAAATAIAVAVVALVTLGRSPARTHAASSPGVTGAALRSSADRALQRLVLPSGAVISGLVSGTPAQLWSPSSRLGIPGSVDFYRVWRLRERPDRVINFIEAHHALGSLGGLEGVTGSESTYANGASGRPLEVIQGATGVITLPVTRAGVWRQLALNAVALSGGGTALRVDSEAGWLKPRPSSELIPPGVTRVEFKWNIRGASRGGSVTIAKPARVGALVSALNSLPAGAGTCKGMPGGFFTFVFENGSGSSPLAVATWAPPCRKLDLIIPGRPNVELIAGADTVTGAPFYAQIEELLMRAFPHRRVSGSPATLHSKRCASSQHSTPAVSPSAPGAAAVLCTSASRSTKHASVP